ncbi:MAG: hypothetical protein IT580_04930, partial [Verrucomicrobiales bacterium]|nr:hypothetical protein [Verrucomicrobiales bacterium]
MKCTLNRRRQTFGLTLATASLIAGLLPAPSASAQSTLADFQFNEGTGPVTRSATNDLTG